MSIWKRIYYPVEGGKAVDMVSISQRTYEEALQKQSLLKDTQDSWSGKFLYQLKPDDRTYLHVTTDDIRFGFKHHDGFSFEYIYPENLTDSNETAAFTEMLFFYLRGQYSEMDETAVTEILHDEDKEVWEDVLEMYIDEFEDQES